MKKNWRGYSSGPFPQVSKHERRKEYGKVPPPVIDHRMREGKDKRRNQPSPSQPCAEDIPSALRDEIDRGLEISPEIKFLRKGNDEDLKHRRAPEVREPRRAEACVAIHRKLPEMRSYKIRREDDEGHYQEGADGLEVRNNSVVEEVYPPSPVPDNGNRPVEKQDGNGHRQNLADETHPLSHKKEARHEEQSRSDYGELRSTSAFGIRLWSLYPRIRRF